MKISKAQTDALAKSSITDNNVEHAGVGGGAKSGRGSHPEDDNDAPETGGNRRA